MPRQVTTTRMRLQAVELFQRRPELSSRAVAAIVGMPPATAARLRRRVGLTSPFPPFGRR